MQKMRRVVGIAGLFLIFLQGLNAQNAQPGLLPLQLWQPQQQKLAPLLATDKLTLIVMLSPECPMCINYTLTLNQMAGQFKNNLLIAGVVPGKSYSDEEITAFKTDYKLVFNIFKDDAFTLTRQLNAVVTPEVFLVNPNGEIIYRGAIDNWLTTLGKKKPAPDKYYLLDALQQTLQGKMVSLKRTDAKGCLINQL